jgi:hypothetical protein
MSDRSDIEEAMEMQESVGTEPAMERAMLGESPMRTIASLLGVNQLATGNVQYAFSPLQSETPPMERPRSAPPLMRTVAQGVDLQNDGITEFSRMQKNSPNDFNGADIGVEDGDLGQEGRELSYEDVVLERLSDEQVKDVVRLLVEYVKDEVPIENWEGQPPARTVHLLRTLLKNRDTVTTEGVQPYRLALEKEFKKNQRLSQEIIGALDEVRLAQEAEQLASESELIAKEDVDQYVRLMKESGQRIEELEAELASATQVVENYRATLESVQQELDITCASRILAVRPEFRRVMAGVRRSSGAMEI